MPKHPLHLPTQSLVQHEPRILILSASVGAGHGRAAEAIELALKERLPNATVKNVDVLTLTNSLFRTAYSDGYFEMVRRAPHVTRALYDKLDKPHAEGLVKSIGRGFWNANLRKLTKLLKQQPPWDLVINTHFLPPEIIAHLRNTKQVNFPQATVVTDIDIQGLWFTKPCDAYFVANQEAGVYLKKLGVDPESVHVSGIPVHPVFTEKKDRDECRRKHGFSPDQPLVLQMASGQRGAGVNEPIYRSLRDDITEPTQICVVTGKNAALKQQLEAIGPHPKHSCKIMGFTKEVDELMAAADLVIGKPGGLTISESLARGCPMVVVDPIPGQEERNSDFLLQNQCAIKPLHLETLGHQVNELLNDPARLQQMKESALRCGRPDAARDVAEQCVRLLTARGVLKTEQKIADIGTADQGSGWIAHTRTAGTKLSESPFPQPSHDLKGRRQG